VFNGQQFDVLASGWFGSDTGDPSGTVTVQLYVVTGTLLAPVYTSIATTGAIVPSNAIEPWGLSAQLVGASTPVVAPATPNGLLIGSYEGYARGTFTSPIIVTNVVAGLDFLVGNPLLAQGAVLGFVVGVTFGTSDATNKAALSEFTIES
jgi:hypothetical protein